MAELVQSIQAANRRNVSVTNIMICDIHWSDTVSEFCVSHKKAICRLCKLTKHRKCDTKDLWEAAENHNGNMESLIVDVELLSSDFETMKRKRYRDKCQLLEKTTEIRADVKRLKENIIIWAGELERGTLEEIERIEMDMVSNIDSHIAVTCDMINHLELVKTSLENLDVGTNYAAAFLLKTNTELQIQEGRELKQEIQTEVCPVTFNFYKSDKLSSLMSGLLSFGIIETEETRFVDLKDISRVTKKADIAVNTDCITGCVFMPNGELVICDYSYHKVTVLTSEFELKNELQCNSPVWDIAVLSSDEVIVTKTDSVCLEVLNVSTTVEKVKSILVGEECFGVDVKKDNIYVSCHSNIELAGNIHVFTLNGECLNTIPIVGGCPFYLAVNDLGNRIIVSANNYSNVLCIDMTGNTIFTYLERDMGQCYGLQFDLHDNFMVCAFDHGYLDVVKKDGRKHKTLLSSDDGLYQPYCFAYRATDKTLVVGQEATEPLTAFSIEI